MKVKQTLVALGVLVTVMSASIGITALPAQAATCGVGADGKPLQTAIIGCESGDPKKLEENAIWKILILTLNIMATGVGVLAVLGVVWAAVLYTTAADRADQIKKAKDMILNVVIGIVAFGLMYAFLNFLIPGGIFT